MKAALLALVALLAPATFFSPPETQVQSLTAQREHNVTVVYKSYDDLEGVDDPENCDLYLADVEGASEEEIRGSTMLRNE
jgi:hypothetical protein